MALPIKPIIGILSDNLRLRKSVFPLGKGRLTAWSKGLGIPPAGETVLYTGHMYQLMPYIDSLEKGMARIADTPIAKTMGAGRVANRVVNISRFMAFPSKDLIREFDGYLRNIAQLLQKAGIQFGYLYGQELYSGALIHDLGNNKVFYNHCMRLTEMFRKNKVRKVITVDPHTTEILKDVLPDHLEIEVKSYLEVLAGAQNQPPKLETGEPIAIHDSCIYARGLDIIEGPRKLLNAAGIKTLYPEDSGKRTRCCGGPLESLFPEKAVVAAKARMEQLDACGAKTISSMCPICLLNLRKGVGQKNIRIEDISQTLRIDN